jgi:ankyrin repeat protein
MEGICMAGNGTSANSRAESEDPFVHRLTRDESALLVAADAGDLDKVKELITKGVPVDTRTRDPFLTNTTPLMWAAVKGHYEVARYLIENGADVQAHGGIDDTDVVVWAVWNFGDARIVEMLLQKGADVNAFHSSEKKTILTIAAENGNTEIVKLLLENGADVKFPNEVKSKALYYARKYEREGMIEALKEKGAK